ncbi:MAG TPA: inositol monophosphatase family protein [Vicinamibacterales bacterium]|nr:inositol monophosphatase family protein [Vicinamibacterales bacterium]
MPLDPVYLATAIEAALSAGRIHLEYFRRNPRVEKKGPIDLVTAADVEAEQSFRRLIADRFPSHAVLGEEAGASGLSKAAGVGRATAVAARWRWIIDPLDGTTNFAHGLAFFCVSIALEVDGQTELAVVYDPVGKELFSAERGGGAWLNGEPLRVSSRDVLIDALLCTGFPYSIREDQRRQVDVFAGFLGRSRAVRRLGSAALDLSYVAAGRFDGFWEEQLHAWDVAAGVLIVQEAGGRVTGYDDEPIDLFAGRIVASNGALHGAMLEVIRAAYR